MINQITPNTRTIFFGHLGDGNLHYNIFGNGTPPDGFNNNALLITDELYKIVSKYNGSFQQNMELDNSEKIVLLYIKIYCVFNYEKNKKTT